jgi:CHAT domain-containing protein/tetratricopeptide (TPR) repeat protein
MESGPTTRRLFCPALLCLLALTAALGPACAQVNGDPLQLQKSGIARIDHWLDHVRSTGDAVNTRNELATAQVELQTSYVLFMQRQDPAGAVWSAIKLGDIQRYVNQWPQAATIFQNVAKLAEGAKRQDYQIKALSELAFSEMNMGAIDAAEEHAREAVRLGAGCGNKEFYFDALVTAGEVETKRGNFPAAGDYLDRALAMTGEIEDPHRIYTGYSDRGEVYYQNAQGCDFKRGYDVCDQLLQLARDDYKKAQAIAQARGWAFLVNAQNTFLQSVNTLESSTKLAQKGTQEQSANQDPVAKVTFNPKQPKDVLAQDYYFRLGGSVPQNLALVQQYVKEIDDMREQWQQQGLNVPDFDPLTLYVRGTIAEWKNDNNAALTDYLQAVQLLERDRRKLGDEQARSAFMKNNMDYYDVPALILLQQKRYPEAFALFEQSRGRAMADMLASRPVTLGTQQERALFADLQAQRAAIAALQEKLFNLTAGEERERNGQRIADLEAQITALQQKYETFERRIAKEAPKLQELTSAKPVTLESVQQSAAEGRYDVLYYVVMNTSFIVWHISGTDVQVKNVFLPHAMLATKTATLHDSLVAAKDSRGTPFDEDISRQLYLYLIQPMTAYIKSNHLIIVPQEELTAIPFQALQNPQDGNYLGVRFEISYAPSATVLATLEKKPNLKSGRLLAIADPEIHDAGEEVKSIGALYPGRSKVTTQEQVSKADVQAWVGGYDLVHLSVHGKFNASDPLLSYLQFKPGPSDDGRLTAAEMFGLPLEKNSLVVLSACETGRVQATHSGELVGMVRSLLYAGAGTLVLSDWEVNAASTKLWMETFYREGQTREPAEAARLALMAVKSRAEFSHPFFWAPFVVTGK